MVVVKTAKCRGKWNVIGEADVMNRLNQGYLQGQEGVNCDACHPLKSHYSSSSKWQHIALGCNMVNPLMHSLPL